MEKTQSYQRIYPTRIASNWLFWLVSCVLGILVTITFLIFLALWYPPDFYQQALPDPAEADLLARRMISKSAALSNIHDQSGPWQAVIKDQEVNAWLLIDVPKNHSNLFPQYIDSPRIQFNSNHLAIGAKTHWGIFSTIIWFRAKVWLQGVNQVVVQISDAGAGSVPIPHDVVTRHLSSLLTDIGIATNQQRMNGQLVLCLTPPIRDESYDAVFRLEELAIESGELLMAGSMKD